MFDITKQQVFVSNIPLGCVLCGGKTFPIGSKMGEVMANGVVMRGVVFFGDR